MQEGFRKNIGIILTKGDGRVLHAKRKQQSAWQFPQGGIDEGENVEQALFRELYEELGLTADDVEIIAESKQWLSYVIPEEYRRRLGSLVGQTQKWFLLRLVAEESKISLSHSEYPEFDDWCWVDYRYPVDHIVAFKQEVYRKIIDEFSPYLDEMI